MRYFVDLTLPIPEEIEGDFLSKLHYVSTALVGFSLDGNDRVRVAFDVRHGEEGQSKRISDGIREVAEKMAASYRPAEPRVLDRRAVSGQFLLQDPHPELERTNEIHRYGSGRYGLGPQIVRLMEHFDRDLIDLAAEFGASPQQYPSMIGADVMDECRYLRSFPHSLTFISHLREDIEGIQDFARHAVWDGGRLSCNPETLSDVQCLLAPSVCFHCYAWLKGQRLDTPLTVTALGKCFRYESGNLTGLERLWDFSMREIIFVGSQSFVLERRQECMERAASLLDRWEMGHEIRSATDPFFIEDYATQTLFQNAFELKYEIRADLPYKQSSLAAGSFNYHQDFFGRSFRISLADETPAHTSCAGWGLERLALAFVAQHGLEPDIWPAWARPSGHGIKA